ncbi:MAG: 16S rRNA (guanine(527)-N(7))-methyltransferase RsmG [Terriglobales bacterium]
MPATLAHFRQALTVALPEYGVAATPERLERLSSYLAQLARWNERVRLVGEADPDTLARRHVGESLYLAQLLPLSHQTLLDLGSGGGFPGLALQLAFPALKTTLVESKAKKAAFLAEVCRQQALGRVVNQRLEDLSEAAEIVTVRALENLAAGPERFAHLLISGGKLAAWVTEGLARDWQQRLPRWRWQSPRLLPGSRERTIVLAEAPELGLFHVEH